MVAPMEQNTPETARTWAWQRIEALRTEWDAAAASMETVPNPVTPRTPQIRPDDYDRTNFAQVCEYGDLPALQDLLKQGFDTRVDNDFALRVAAVFGHTEIVRLLLGLGANVWAMDDDPIAAIVENGHFEILRLLLDKDPIQVHEGDDYPLILAAEHGLTAMVGLLLEYGANIHARDDYALKMAACNEHQATVVLLIEQGAPSEALTPEQYELYHAFKGAPKKAVQAEQVLSTAFQSAVWSGHVPEMLDLWNQVPERLKTEIDFSHVLSEARRQSMKQYKSKITLVK